MMKKILCVGLLVLTLVMIGCASSNKLSADEIFEKKKECINLTTEIEKKYNDADYYVASVFYSEQKNSCIFRLSSYKLATQPNHILYDYFTDKEIVNKNDMCIPGCKEQQEQFNKILEELQGE